uniref:Protein kinase domain-containing protein n=1 Tax=Neobodo designis TaxID=312471 RepID=A0A7S1PM36_NEODS|mmetsp:Transcript_12224/g.38040  ORF Transcript_12224/g.38040 Transcript_12224/m.38040 type:complete len:300 (+) Transcript_12224:53-952(+)|eukprot:CAMPEP_0174854650 /NCGR_PEP_ID=MMETSP1114-20130205/31879_1 /TAXON_ID=312471 /ORGANISM="Neobodo designis, Strain CCAP 1951/1" /LENGTH=299 /DNA_ID=CAMNT_0016089361 /DNA_START=49 /DNA_END=948 /DNA_ORIENTATION=+
MATTVNPITQFKPSDFEGIALGKKLGAGTYGTVHVGLLKDGRYVAVKQLIMEDGEDSAADNREIAVHSQLSHPNIIRYLHSSVDKTASPAQLNVYLEFVTGGSLTAIMKTLPGACLPRPVVKVYARHIFQGLAYLHSQGFAHRDVKGDNVLISQDQGVAKLADFDQAKIVAASVTFRRQAANNPMGNPSTTLAGTPFWIAPEVITQEDGYDAFKADVWSGACTIAEMVTGRAPWQPMSSPMGIMYKLANSEGWPDAIPSTKAELGDDLLWDLLDKCFTRDAAARPSAADVLNHGYFQSA